MRRLGALRPERLLPLACLGAAVVLVFSQASTIFELNAAPGQTLDKVEAVDQHQYAMLVLGLFAIVAVLVAAFAGSKPAAVAVAVAGLMALLLFLLIDLPDAGKVGTVDDPRQSFFSAKAEPAAGFWLELIGALLLAICGSALATFSAEQLRSIAPRLRLPPRRGSGSGPRPTSAVDGSDPISTATGAGEELAQSDAAKGARGSSRRSRRSRVG